MGDFLPKSDVRLTPETLDNLYFGTVIIYALDGKSPLHFGRTGEFIGLYAGWKVSM